MIAYPIGVNERDDETLYNTQLLFVADLGEGLYVLQDR